MVLNSSCTQVGLSREAFPTLLAGRKYHSCQNSRMQQSYVHAVNQYFIINAHIGGVANCLIVFPSNEVCNDGSDWWHYSNDRPELDSDLSEPTW